MLYFRYFFTKKTSKILAIIEKFQKCCEKKLLLFDKLHDNNNDDNDTNDNRDTRLLYSVYTKPTTGCPQKNKANYFWHGVIKQQLKALIFSTAIQQTIASLAMVISSTSAV